MNTGLRVYFFGIAMLLNILLVAQPNFLEEGFENRQKPIAKSAVSLELGGNALLYSLNFDRVLVQSDTYKGTLRIGVGVLPYLESVKENRTFLFVPIEFNNLFGPYNHFFELGLGITLNNSIQGANHWITGRAGYRVHPFKTGFYFRTGIVLVYIPYANPLMNRNESRDFFLPIPSVAWGVAF